MLLDDPNYKRFYDLAFAKCPAEEFYDQKRDPRQLNNIAAMPDYSEVKRKLTKRLMTELKATGDPRVIGGGEEFDRYLYRRGAVRSR